MKIINAMLTPYIIEVLEFLIRCETKFFKTIAFIDDFSQQKNIPTMSLSMIYEKLRETRMSPMSKPISTTKNIHTMI